MHPGSMPQVSSAFLAVTSCSSEEYVDLSDYDHLELCTYISSSHLDLFLDFSKYIN